MQDVIALATQYGIALVFLGTFATRLGAPVPGSAVLVIAGGLVMSGELGATASLTAAVAGNLLGDAAWFYAGRRYGARVMRLLCKVSLSPDSCVRRSEALITDWGGMSLLAAKFVPGVSVVAAPMAGALHMPLRRFVAFDTLASLAWSALYLGLGFVFGNQVQAVLDAMAGAGTVGGALLAALLVIWLGNRWWRRRAMRRSLAVPRISVGELLDLIDGEPAPVILDVRGDASAGLNPQRIPGAIAVRLKELEQFIPQLPTDREVVLYCDCPNEVSAARAASVLAARGIRRARPLAGGLAAWLAATPGVRAAGTAGPAPEPASALRTVAGQQP